VNKHRAKEGPTAGQGQDRTIRKTVTKGVQKVIPEGNKKGTRKTNKQKKENQGPNEEEPLGESRSNHKREPTGTRENKRHDRKRGANQKPEKAEKEKGKAKLTNREVRNTEL